MTDTDSVAVNSVFANVVGDTTRTRVLKHLSECDSPQRQVDIAADLGISEASVSRAKQTLIDVGVVEVADGGLQTTDGVERALNSFERALQ